MQIEHVALLPIQRELQSKPRTLARFQEYLATMVGETEDIDLLPLVAMNPMGREHITERLDALLAFDAEGLAAGTVSIVADQLACSGHFRHGMVVSDDVHGGWTNRYTSEAATIFDDRGGTKRSWITTVLWASDQPTPDRVRRSVLRAIRRAVHHCRHGLPKTLGQMMHQEGLAAAFAGMQPHLDAEDIAYTREILYPLRTSTNWAVNFSAMYGDAAARLLGYEPLGLSDRAGFALGLADVLENGNGGEREKGETPFG